MYCDQRRAKAASNIALKTFAYVVLALPSYSIALESATSPGQRGALDVYPPTSVEYFVQEVDHFRYNLMENSTFKQKYLVYDKFWNGDTGPIFFYFGNEGAIEDFYNNTGAMFEIGKPFGALLVFLEHRYYGVSVPVAGSQSSRLGTSLQFLTIEQALADTAMFLSSKNKLFGCANSKDACKVVLFGGSYGGMLAAWFRVKYRHLCHGALAASAPVDIYPGESKESAFYEATIDVYRKYGSDLCAQRLDQSFQVLSNFTDVKLLTKTFNPCVDMVNSADIDRLSFYAKGAFATLAMVDYPYPTDFITPLPGNPVKLACERLLDSNTNDTSIESLMQHMNDAMNVFVNYTGQLRCHNISMEMVGRNYLKSVGAGLGSIYDTWNYQACTQLILEPLTTDGNGFFVESESQISQVEAACQRRYPGIVTRPLWMLKAYGSGADIVKHTSNVIFSDGDKDPWSIGGVPMNSSSADGSSFHLYITDSAHHQDLRFSDPLDSASLQTARIIEQEAIARWIS